ncbi:uncharacterized protein [Penaeus vannamei]|uniref:Uncharacterized protein n=1 Tax=Penaeus vannamei TaxID=6689 RepID=A0A423SP06_PENVA|nr:uncharacterized protein LOC113819576 [Penaeus vannamei]ROT65874.1 hypothetical protein C7M84_016141 [Penaeus vannamei]
MEERGCSWRKGKRAHRQMKASEVRETSVRAVAQYFSPGAVPCFPRCLIPAAKESASAATPTAARMARSARRTRSAAVLRPARRHVPNPASVEGQKASVPAVRSVPADLTVFSGRHPLTT